MRPSRISIGLSLLLMFLLTGCLRPRRNAEVPHSYVLSPLPSDVSGTFDATREVGVGIGPVEVPAYLFDTRMLMRKGNSEVRYAENHRWAERIDKGIQRILGVNLALLLESDRIMLSAWQREAVRAELYLTVQRFDCDEHGQVVLDARWRIAAPGGDRTLLTRHSHIVRQMEGAPREADQIVAELSHALADLSREIAAALPAFLAAKAE